MQARRKISLVIPSLRAGGMERVMIQLASYFAAHRSNEVVLILLTRGTRFYDVPAGITVVEPDFLHRKYGRLTFTIKIFRFLRYSLKRVNPEVVLSFGGKYNSFVLLAAVGLRLKVIVSDRSRPGISYGRFLDVVNRLLYRSAYGIIAQTEKAREYYRHTVKHENISVIGNPIEAIQQNDSIRENWILNVGRFIPSKRQLLLMELFAKLDKGDWQLVFLGDGQLLQKAVEKAKALGIEKRVVFAGNRKDIDEFYQRSKIFAFTSVSEGFPNALGEAMSAGLACISFDCIAGPSDLIDDGVNGYLIPLEDETAYLEKLGRLMSDSELRDSFGVNAKTKVQNFKVEVIGKRFYDFMLTDQGSSQ